MTLRYVSVCSGIEAATVAWAPLGWRAIAFSEIEPFPCAVLAHHYPSVPNLGDLNRYREWPDVGPVDVLVGGTPCQSFSVAGLRAGLDDPRGNLALVYLGLAERLRPRWVVWENVPGVRSSGKGRDFAAFLGGLAQLGYGWAYRSLDAQFFGLAQRRERVFVVGHLGDWRCAASVLLELSGLRGDPPPSREAREGVAHELAPCIGASGRGFSRAGETRGQDPVAAHALNAKGGSGRSDAESETLIAETMRSHPRPGSWNVGLLTTHTLRADGFDASEDGTGRGTPLVPDVAPTLRSASDSPRAHGKQNGTDRQALIPVAFNGRMDPVPGAVPGALDTDPSSQCVAFGLGQCTSPTHRRQPTDRTGALNGNMREAGASAMAVRRLTPLEWERLQGFPDRYTLVPYGKRGRPAKDGPRYKALGNSMAVPVVRWIGQRIEVAEAIVRANLRTRVAEAVA